MTLQEITTLFTNYKQYNTELLILQECVDELQEGETEEIQGKYAILKRRLVLIDHWINFLPRSEAEILKMHLIEGRSWVYIANQLSSNYQGSISCDERTLQRMQAKALARIESFVSKQFVNKLDYLADPPPQRNLH